MAGRFHTYDGDQVTISYGGKLLSGLADGEAVRIEQESDDFSDVVGTDGDVTRSKTNDHRATITVMLMQTSRSNDVLSAFAEEDLDNPDGAGVRALTIKDLSGDASYKARKAWIQRRPDVSFDREATSREWVFRCTEIKREDKGN